ncbi:hypothetical protein H6503_02755 [Candidatus Woesearchaeota archaeon]|nr:hypothetical protein [Candidatus Woesearchaeota archaeon]
MKIEVDTKTDSKEEIRHAIRVLKAALGEDNENFSNNGNSSSSGFDSRQDSDGYVNLFAPNPTKEEQMTNAEPEPVNPLVGFFDSPASQEPTTIIEEKEDTSSRTRIIDDEESTFFKEYEDEEESDKKKPRIQFY